MLAGDAPAQLTPARYQMARWVTSEDPAELRKFIEAFTADERIGGVIRTYAAQTAEQERKAARNKAEKAAAQEMTALRDLKLLQIESELHDIKQAQLAQLDDARGQRLKELNDELEQRQAADEEALQRGAGARRDARNGSPGWSPWTTRVTRTRSSTSPIRWTTIRSPCCSGPTTWMWCSRP